MVTPVAGTAAPRRARWNNTHHFARIAYYSLSEGSFVFSARCMLSSHSHRILTVWFVIGLWFVVPPHASAAIVRGTHHGSGTRGFMAIAHAVAASYGVGCAGADVCAAPLMPLSVSLTDAEIGFACSMQRSIPHDAPDALTDWIGQTMARIMGRHAKQILPILKDSAFCAPSFRGDSKRKADIMVHIAPGGSVVSSNPVWNACVRGESVSRVLIRSNEDFSLYHRGRVSKKIPFTCRDYHRGDVHLWQHPDFPGLEIHLDERGRLLGGLPAGFALRKDARER